MLNGRVIQSSHNLLTGDNVISYYGQKSTSKARNINYKQQIFGNKTFLDSFGTTTYTKIKQHIENKVAALDLN